MPLPSANPAQFLYTIDTKNMFAVWVFSLTPAIFCETVPLNPTKKPFNVFLYNSGAVQVRVLFTKIENYARSNVRFD